MQETNKAQEPNSNHLAETLVELALDLKALNPLVLDLREKGTYTDFLVIVSGTSDRHVQAIAEHVVQEMKSRGERAVGQEGFRDGQWALVDFGDAVLHVFHEFSRGVYQLEDLWNDAPRLPLQAPSA